STMYQARNELSDVEERADGVRLSIAQTEEKLSQARHDKTKLEVDSEIEFNRELTSVESEIAEENLALLSGERLIRAAAGSGRPVMTLHDLSILITRRTANGIQRFTAQVRSPLQAGDLLEIDTVRVRAEAATDKL